MHVTENWFRSVGGRWCTSISEILHKYNLKGDTSSWVVFFFLFGCFEHQEELLVVFCLVLKTVVTHVSVSVHVYLCGVVVKDGVRIT